MKNNFEKNFENKLLDIESKLNSLSQNQKDNLDLDLVKLNLRNNEINQDTIDNLDKKITELRKTERILMIKTMIYKDLKIFLIRIMKFRKQMKY